MKPLSRRIWNRERRNGFRMLMGAEVSTIEHRNVALVALEHDRSAQGFCKTETVKVLPDSNYSGYGRQKLQISHKKVIAKGFARQ